MHAAARGSRWMHAWAGALLCALFAIQPQAGHARATQKPAPTLLLTQPPALRDLPARLVWATAEADVLRAYIISKPRDALGWVYLSALAIEVTRSIEYALAIGDIGTATNLFRVIEKKLADTPLRLKWLAQHRTPGADYALGVMALHGILQPRDAPTGCLRLSAAWENGFREAAFRLAECQKDADPVRAAGLLLTAAQAGNAAANEQIGRRCLESQPPDLQCASTRVVAAASAGRASAKSLLGWMTAQGVGMASDPVRALALYLEAANAGDLSARNNLGELHETGRGMTIDTGRAAAYYRAAAEAGFAPAQFNLGRMYATGSGVMRDFDEARKWLRSALRGGIAPAQKILDWLDAQAAPVSR